MKLNNSFVPWDEIILAFPEHLPSWHLGALYEVIRIIYASVRSQYCSAYTSEQVVKSMVEEMRKIIDTNIIKTMTKQSKL